MASPKKRAFNTVETSSGDQIFAPDAHRWVDSLVLVADVAQVYTIPAGINFVEFSPDDPLNNFYVRYSDNAAPPTWPSAGVTDGSDWWPNPASYVLRESTFDRIHVVSPVAMTLYLAGSKL